MWPDLAHHPDPSSLCATVGRPVTKSDLGTLVVERRLWMWLLSDCRHSGLRAPVSFVPFEQAVAPTHAGHQGAIHLKFSFTNTWASYHGRVYCAH